MTATNNGTTMLAQHPRFHGGKSMQTLLRWHEQQEQPHETSATKKNDHPAAADTFEQELQQQLFASSTRSVSHSSHSDSDSDHDETKDRWRGAEILPPIKFEIEGPSSLMLGGLPPSGDTVDAIAVTIDATDPNEQHFIFTGLAEDFLFVTARQDTDDDDDDDHDDETRNEHEAPPAAGAAPRAVSTAASSRMCHSGSNPEDDDNEDPAPKRRKISMEEDDYEADTQEEAAAASAPSRSCLSLSTRRTTTTDHRNYIGKDSS